MLCRYLYRSITLIKPNDPELTNIYALARSRNADFNITGCLHLEDGVFYQWIEGPSQDLDMIMNLILADKKHSNLEILSSGPSLNRRFGGWSMAAPVSGKEALFEFLATNRISKYQRKLFLDGILTYMVKYT
ncbi:BLUF domain-containing protein [Paracoccus sp. S4493]|uniref:BLUF domain-containing protein n=1 Tax=Paracoccus sp. S4493 TaxID=579490 RepID=UPI0009FC1E76|nr:BLUF domain-containing protein [Paracoccus sp. S4493]